jgi:hypothetical protein
LRLKAFNFCLRNKPLTLQSIALDGSDGVSIFSS